MSLAGCQINPTGFNFQLQKSLEIFDKYSADKIGSKKDKEIKVSCQLSLACLTKLAILHSYKYHQILCIALQPHQKVQKSDFQSLNVKNNLNLTNFFLL